MVHRASPEPGPEGPIGRRRGTLVRVSARAGRHAPLLQELVGTVASALDGTACIALVEGEHLIRYACAGRHPRPPSEVPVPVGTVCETALRERRPVRQDGPARTPEQVAAAGCCPGARSALSVPLVHGDQVFGVVSVTSHRDGWFDQMDERHLAGYAGEAARELAALGLPGRRPRGRRSAAPPALATVPAPAVRTGALLEGVGLWRWDRRGERLELTPAAAAALGVGPDQAVDLDRLRALVHPHDVQAFDAAVLALLQRTDRLGRVLRLAGGRTVQLWAEVHRDGGEIASAWGAVVEVTGPWGSALDAAPPGRAPGSLRGRLAGLRAAQELTGLGLWEWHPAEDRLLWSVEMFELAGLDPAGPQPDLATWHGLVHPEDLARATRLDLAAVRAAAEAGTGAGPVAGSPGAGVGEPVVETFRVIGADGVQRHVQAWSCLCPDPAEGLLVCGAAIDVTRQIRDRVRLERLSVTDALTGLINRAGFERRFAELLADPQRDVALLLLDLDRFKGLNDTLGHQVGDRLLREVARRLTELVPGDGLIARMGGDEFVVVPHPGIGWREVRLLAQSLVESLRLPYVLPDSGEVLVCPVSIGVTSTSGRQVTATDLLGEADLALYQAKDAGRDRYMVFDDGLRARARGRHQTEQLLRSALEHGELVLHYQPIVDFVAGAVVGAEALVRIRDGGAGSLLTPETFIEVAEESGLVVEVDCWVIDTALDQLARWAQRPPRGVLPWVAVNVSPRSMEHPRVVQRLLDGIEHRRIAPGRLRIELTEHSFLGALPGGENALRELIDSGVPVGIDDFGTGYSALAYLSRFHLDFMKIDRSFVHAVGQEERADAVVRAIVDLAHAHGMKVTAEGIETARQAERLRELGCDYAQGFHFGRPGDPWRVVGH